MANKGKYIIGIRLLLLKEYLQANAGRDRIITRKQIEAFLEDKGYPVEKKNLYTDFGILEAEFGLQMEYDVHKKGYRLLNPPFEPYELRLMVDGVQSSKFITKEKAREITGKIKTLAGKDTVESLNRHAYVADRVRNMNDSVVKDADRIHEAIKGDWKIGLFSCCFVIFSFLIKHVLIPVLFRPVRDEDIIIAIETRKTPKTQGVSRVWSC